MDPIGTVTSILQSGVDFFRTLLPGGFGLLILPLGALAIISLWFARRSR